MKAKRILRKPVPLYYHPHGSVFQNEYGTWTVFWRTPHRGADGRRVWKTHGKVIAPKSCTEEQAREKADKFLAGLKIPLVEDEVVEQMREEVDLILAKQKAFRGRGAIAIEKEKPFEMKEIAFDPPAIYLLDCSARILAEYLLLKNGHAANMRKDLADGLDKLVKCEGEALVARWMIKNREALIEACQKIGTEPASKALDALHPNSAAAVAIEELAQRLLGTGKG